jgi:hypothetical protein
MSKDQSLDECDGLTYRGYKCKVLQHHMEVQAPLSCIKEHPFLLVEGDADILKGPTGLPWLGQRTYDELLS